MNCDKCVHGRKEPAGLICRRFPPAATPTVLPAPPTPSNPHGGISVQAITVWPTVKPEDSCGEYKARLAVQ